MKTSKIIAIIAGTIVTIMFGLIGYSYTQIQISLENISFQSLDVSMTPGSLVKATINGIIGNWLGAALDLVTGIKLGLGFGLSNHGFFPVYIPDISYDLLVNDIKVGQGQSHIDQTINPGDTKSIQDTQDIQFSSLKPVVGSIIDSGGIVNLKVSGTAYFSLLGISVPIPFESTKQINVVDELKNKILENSQNSASTNYYQPPTTVGTAINIQASTYSVAEGQTVTFTGRLTDSSGNSIQNALVYLKRDITLMPDEILNSGYADNNGQFSITWSATKPLTSNTANIYVTFEGGSGYSSARSNDVQIQVYEIQSTQPNPNQNAPTLQQQLQLGRGTIQYSNTNTKPSFQIANSVYGVSPSTYTYIPFNMQCTGTLTGQFSSQAALGDNIIVYVVDPTGLRQFQSGGSAYTYYNSGKVASGTLNIGLASGQYYLILSNTYSTFSTKNVSLQASYTCS